MNRLIRVALMLFSTLGVPHMLAARQANEPIDVAGSFKIMGTVTAEHSGKPIVGAEVELLGLRRVTRSDARGEFVFEGLPVGTYQVTATAAGYATETVTTKLPGDGAVPSEVVADFKLDLHFHEAPVIITASPNPKDPFEVYQPTSVLGPKDLEKRGGESLGRTLQNEPGITTTDLGTAPARPVIRGMGGDRVLILEDGTRMGDVSGISPDHAVPVDSSSAESIEIVRGPANLLYGSNATGGVINILNQEIPSHLVDRPTGSVSGSAASNVEEYSGTMAVSASAGPVAFHVGGSRRDADSFHFRRGVAGNSQYDFDGYHAGVSLVGKAGFVGAGFRFYEGDYGIPVSDAGSLLREGEKGVTIGLEQKSYKLTGQLTRQFGPFTGARLQAVRRDYTHTEFEDTGEAGTVFNQDATEVRADITHRAVGKMTGTFGGWLLDNGFEAEGDEALVKEAKTKAYAGFFYEELALEKVHFLFGGRYDTQRVDPGPTLPERNFSSWSGALGAVINPGGHSSVAVNLTSNFKAPSAEELYANGPHIATFLFEFGDNRLDAETSLGVDLSYRWQTERFDGEVSVFRTDFNDFILIRRTGTFDAGSGLEIANYEQADALFQGVEAHADVSLREHLILELVGDMVRAENTDTDRPLPQIPPYRAGVGLTWDKDRLSLGGETRYAGKQDRVAPDESPTDAYTIYNVFSSIRLQSGRVVHRIALRGENLTNRFYRNHVSLVKDIVPQPGRMARLTYSLLF